MRSRFYAAERLVLNMFDRAGPTRTVQIAGAELTLPVEARFGSIDSVRDHVREVLAMPAVQERFPRAAVQVSVRARRGSRQAHYQPESAMIAIPESREGRWAMRELVALHEIAHHLDDSGGPAHGPGFADTLIDLVGIVLGPEAAFVYRVVFADSGL